MVDMVTVLAGVLNVVMVRLQEAGRMGIVVETIIVVTVVMVLLVPMGYLGL
ncbi:colicin-A [Escherichia coli]|nr:colicin-A [Escherichia coli]MCI3092800.1 colicin-A [Escherichia coli]